MCKRGFVSLLVCFLMLAGCAQRRYEVVLVPRTDTNWASIKYNRVTGETWRGLDGKWKKFAEPEPLPKSRYKVTMVSLGTSWAAIRLDERTGKTWRARSRTAWTVFPEAEPSPAK